MKEKNVIKVSIPIFIELVFLTLYGSVDTIMLSRYSDTAAGSVSVANQLFMLFAILINVIALGIGAVASQYVGANQIQKAKDTIKTGLYASIIIGVVLFIMLFIFRASILQLVGIDEALFDDAFMYLKWVSVSIIFLAIRVVLSTGFRVFSKSGLVTKIMIIGNVINIMFNALLIYGYAGLPSLGAEGAALGTLIARILVITIFIYLSYDVLEMKVFKVAFDVQVLKKMMKVGLPGALENFSWNVTQVVILSFLNQISVNAVVTRTYVYTILSYVFIYSLALSSANGIISGYYIGEKNTDQAYKQTFKTLKIALVGTWILVLFANLFSRHILGLFSQDETIITLGQQVLWIAFIIETGRTLNLLFLASLRAAGDTLTPLLIAMIIMFVVHIPLSYVLGIHFKFGLFGIMIAASIDELFRGIANTYRYVSKKWMSQTLIND
jgi:putative MATE family efflux protein